MTREQKYTEFLRALGVYQDAFDPEIHTLATMERELQRMLKAWKADGAPTEDITANGTPTMNKTLSAIMQMRRDILAHRDALGLTPKALNRLQSKADTPEEPAAQAPTPLDIVRSRRLGSA